MKVFAAAFLIATAMIAGSSAGGDSDCAAISVAVSNLSPVILEYIKNFIMSRPELHGFQPRGLVADDLHLVFNDLLNGVLSHSNLTAHDNNVIKGLLDPILFFNQKSSDGPEAMMMKCIIKVAVQLKF